MANDTPPVKKLFLEAGTLTWNAAGKRVLICPKCWKGLRRRAALYHCPHCAILWEVQN